jgi:hypothetical protein
MIDWELVARIAGGGFGSTLLVLAIISAAIWLIGVVAQRRAKRNKG